MAQVEKIIVHYKGEDKPTVLNAGFVGRIENDKDLEIDFLNVSENDIQPIMNGLIIALKQAVESQKMMKRGMNK